MKNVFTDKKLLLILIIDIVITVGLPFLIHLFCRLAGVTNFAYPLLFAIFTAINGLLAYLVGDFIILSYKHKNDIVTSPVPDDVIIRSRKIRYPFIISLLVDLTIFVIFCIVYTLTHTWPLM